MWIEYWRFAVHIPLNSLFILVFACLLYCLSLYGLVGVYWFVCL